MSQAKIMTIALNKRMENIKRRTAHLPFTERVRAYLKVVRRNEHRRHDLGAAACDCARAAIMKLYCSTTSLTFLQYEILTPEERVRCYEQKLDAKRLAFDRWLYNVCAPDDWRACRHQKSNDV